MKINNTNTEYSIKQKNNLQKKVIAGGIIISSLFIALATVNLKTATNTKQNTNQVEIESGDEGYDYYSMKYDEALGDINEEDYDEEFIDIYNHSKCIINGEEYDIQELYLVKLEDNSIHLIKAGDNRVDILTKKSFDSKRKAIMRFRNSTIFYKLYTSGMIKDSVLSIDSNKLNEYISNWDGSEHYEIPELAAEKKAHDAYTKKYGR